VSQVDASNTPADEPAHDVLAAEAFAVPASDPALRHAPVSLPDDPSGIAEPHDILAAEEFAMPASRATEGGAMPGSDASRSRRLAIGAAAGLMALVTLRRRRG
jgi:hypothetical protein